MLDQGVPSAASTPTGTGMAGRESGVTREGEDAGGESEPEEEEIVLARVSFLILLPLFGNESR